MKDRPIIFSAAIIRAILDGRKTQTRRTVSERDCSIPLVSLSRDAKWSGGGFWWEESGGTFTAPGRCPYGAVGDRLWVKHRADLFPVYYKPIRGWEELYAAGTDGQIYRTDRSEPEQLKGSPSSRGYLTVSLSRGEWETHSVHRLVCETFYGPPPAEDVQVRHLDGCRTNNLPENLDWGTAEQNWQDRKAHGRGMGAEHHAAKLTSEQVAQIRRSSLPQRVLAKQFGVSQSTIHGARSGATWQKHAPAGRTLPAFQQWRSPLFMPRWASRITLEVTDVRVQRLQEISEDDARAEGVEPGDAGDADLCGTSRGAFYRLWDSINGKRAPWSSNPWIWALTFRRLP